MEIRILDVSEMKLIGRKVVRFEVEHQSRPTSSIWETKDALAAAGGFKSEGTMIVKIDERSGNTSSQGEAHIYESEEEMRKWEPRHIILANFEPSARKSALEEMKRKRTEAKAAKTGVKK